MEDKANDKSEKQDVPEATTISATTAAQESITDSDDGLGIEDLSLPRAVVTRVSKSVLPANAQIQKEAVLAISKSATAFVNYISSHANENALRANKKTIRPEDVIEAAKEVEFGAFVPQLQEALKIYNAKQVEKTSQRRTKLSAQDAASTEAMDGKSASADTRDAIGGREKDDSPPATKRARRESGKDMQKLRKDEGDENEEASDVIAKDDDEEDELDEENEDIIEDLRSSEDDNDDGGNSNEALLEDPVEKENDLAGDDDDDALGSHESD